MIIDQLLGRNGDVRALLGQENAAGVFDLSNDAWDERNEVLTELRFQEVRFENVDFFVKFAQCRFERSEFLRTRSDGRFWGVRNSWEECRFDGLKLRDMYSSENTFRDCVFSDSAVTKYTPYQTLFEHCSFKNFKVTRMRAKLVLNSTSINLELGGHTATVLFRGCKFERSTFKESYFAGVGFEDCTFVDSEALDCDFSGIEGLHPWSTEKFGDPLHVLFDKVLRLIHKRLGADSLSGQEMQKYIEEYRNGATRDLDFAGRLRERGTASGEWEKIADAVLELLEEYF